MSDMNPLNQLAQYQAYMANQSGEDDPFKLSPDALTQLVIGSLGKKKGLATLGSQLSRLSSINSLLGKPPKENLDPQYVQAPSVIRSTYGNDPVYSKLFDDIDAGKPLHQVVTEFDAAAPKLGADYQASSDAIKAAAADYAKEKAQNTANRVTYDAQHPRQAPTMPSRDDLVQQLIAKMAPSQTKERLAASPRGIEQARMDEEVAKTGVSFTPQEMSARLQTAGRLHPGGGRIDPRSAEAADARRRRVIEQVVARKLGGG